MILWPDIRHGTGRWAMHPAEVLALALQSGGRLPAEPPERRYLEPPAKVVTGTVVAAAGALTAGALLMWLGSRRRQRA